MYMSIMSHKHDQSMVQSKQCPCLMSVITCLDAQLASEPDAAMSQMGYTISLHTVCFYPFYSTHRAPVLDRRGSWAPSKGSPQPPPRQPTPSRPAPLRAPGKVASFGSQQIRPRPVMQAGSRQVGTLRCDLGTTEATKRFSFAAKRPVIHR